MLTKTKSKSKTDAAQLAELKAKLKRGQEYNNKIENREIIAEGTRGLIVEQKNKILYAQAYLLKLERQLQATEQELNDAPPKVDVDLISRNIAELEAKV